jgi:hypothetical protein
MRRLGSPHHFLPPTCHADFRTKATLDQYVASVALLPKFANWGSHNHANFGIGTLVQSVDVTLFDDGIGLLDRYRFRLRLFDNHAPE